MPSSPAEPVWNEPVLRLPLNVDGERRTYLVASELHLGLESELARQGAFLRSRTQGLADRLLNLVEKERARHLILLGDVKHRIARLSAQERRDVPAFFDRLAPLDAVHVALGNHDAGLQTLLPRHRFPNLTLHPPAGFLLSGDGERVACLHGHAWPRPSLLAATTFLVGHTHAAASLVDEDGQRRVEWAWLRGHLDPDAVERKYGRRSTARVIVFPPFNPLCGGSAINRDGLLGPFSRLVDLARAELHLLDGRALGPVGKLPRAPRKTKKPSPDSLHS